MHISQSLVLFILILAAWIIDLNSKFPHENKTGSNIVALPLPLTFRGQKPSFRTGFKFLQNDCMFFLVGAPTNFSFSPILFYIDVTLLLKLEGITFLQHIQAWLFLWLKPLKIGPNFFKKQLIFSKWKSIFLTESTCIFKYRKLGVFFNFSAQATFKNKDAYWLTRMIRRVYESYVRWQVHGLCGILTAPTPLWQCHSFSPVSDLEFWGRQWQP